MIEGPPKPDRRRKVREVSSTFKSAQEQVGRDSLAPSTDSGCQEGGARPVHGNRKKTRQELRDQKLVAGD